MARTSHADLGFDDDLLPESGFNDDSFDGGMRVEPARQQARSPLEHSALGLNPATGLSPQPMALPQPATPQVPAPQSAMPQPVPAPRPQQPLLDQTPPPAQPNQPPTPGPFTPQTPTVPTPAATSFKPSWTPEDKVAYNTLLSELQGFAAGGLGNFGVQIQGIDTSRLTPEQVYNKLFETLKSPTSWSRPPDTTMRTRIDEWLGKAKSALSGAGAPAGQSDADKARQNQFDASLQRLEQVTGYGGREAEEELLSGLSSRGLLDSGIAARELGRFRQEKFARLSDAASRINEILYSNASEDIRRESLLRLGAQLQFENESALTKLRSQLAQQYQDNQHRNDFMGFLGDVVGTAAPLLIPGAGPALGIAGAVSRGMNSGHQNYGDIFGVDSQDTNDPYGYEVAT